jgi:hypothetical protein
MGMCTKYLGPNGGLRMRCIELVGIFCVMHGYLVMK